MDQANRKTKDIIQELETELRKREVGWWNRLTFSIPELNALADTKQPPEYHSEGDVGKHTSLAIEACPEGCDPDLLWAALLHDIGKPSTTTETDGRIRALGHDRIGAVITEDILTRLGMPTHRKERIVWAVRRHLFHHSWQLKDIDDASKKHLAIVASPDFPLLLELTKVDALASKGHLQGLETYEFYKRLRQVTITKSRLGSDI